MIWEYYNLLIYDTQAIFADEKFVNATGCLSFKIFICENWQEKYLSAKI